MGKNWKTDGPGLLSWSVLKILRVMKLMVVLICLVGLLSSYAKSDSQNKKLSIEFKNSSIENVLNYIESHSDYSFMYDNKKINTSRKITISVKDQTIEAILNQIFDNSVNYKTIGKHIIITPKEEAVPGTKSQQQHHNISGYVTDLSGAPLPGVTVIIKGSSSGTMTDATGKYNLSGIPANSILQVSFIGKKSQEIPIAGKASVNITMVEDAVGLDEVVAIGYGTQKRELMSGSVVSMKMTQTMKNIPTTSVGNLLAGQMSGVKVSTPAGPPGTQPTITIRAKTSWNDQPVLYVIDGKISGSGDFNNLSPNDIDNISVLKDAATTAVYGARSAGGVIVVTTKRGTKNTTAQINYSFSTGFDKRGKNAELTSAVETGRLYNRINPGANDLWTQSDFDYFAKINNGWGYNQLDAIWQDPYTTTHNLSASGGGEKYSYFVGGSYIEQGSFMKNVTYNKYNIRANITADLTGNLTLFAGITVNNNKSKMPPSTSVGDVYGIYRKLLLWQPEQPVWTDGGNPINYGWIGNVGAEVRGDGGYIKTNDVKPIVNLQLTYKVPFIKGLSASAQYNRSFTNNRKKYFLKKYDMWTMKTLGSPRQLSTKDEDLISLKKSSQIGQDYLRESYSWGNDYQLNLQLNYDHTFNNVHHIKGWLIYERAESNGGGMSGTREKFPVYMTDQWWATSEDRADSYVSGDTEFTNGRKSWVGQFFYDYNGKYLASFAYRYDGSMNFAADKRWGFFPSGSIGWVISKENFFKNIGSIELLKLRASAGITGNDAVGGWQWMESFKSGSSAYFGTVPSTNVGIQYGSLTNKDLTWEKSLNYNVGVDVSFLKHFDASIEGFATKTYDILGARIASVPPTFPRSLPSSNYGRVDAKGLEVSIGYKNNYENLNYYLNANVSYAFSKYVTIDENITYPYQKQKGNYISRLLGFECTGMIRTQADLDAFKKENPGYNYYGVEPDLGQLTYKDLSGPNGKPDGVIDDYDYTIIKNNNHPVNVGINLGIEWKGITVDATFNGAFHQYKRVDNLIAGNVEWNRMWRKWYTDAWTPETPNATLPRRYSANEGDTFWTTADASTFYMKNSSYLRLKSLNVGYNIPSQWTQKVGISGIKVYFTGTNLFVLSKFNRDYFDPELGDGFSYPIMKNYNFGVNVTF